MEKWENDVKDYVNGPLPDQIEKRIQSTFHQLPRKKKKPVWMYSVAAAVIAVSILVGGSFLSPAFADTLKGIPIIGSLFEKFGDEGIQHAEKEGLGTPMYEVIDIEGKTVTFTKYIYDGSRIALEFKVDPYESFYPDHQRPYDIFGIVNKFFVNGELLQNPKLNIQSTKMPDGSIVGVMKLSPDESLPKAFNLRFKSDYTWVKEDGQIEVKRNIDTNTVVLDKTFKSDEITLTYEDVSVSPLTTSVNIKAKIKTKLWEEEHFDFQVIDSNGNVLGNIPTGFGGPIYDGYLHVDIKQFFNPIEHESEFITIRPYLLNHDIFHEDSTQYSKKWTEEPMTLSQGELGDIKVLDVNQQGDEVKVTFQPLGEFPHLQNDVYVSHTEQPNFYGYEDISEVEYVNGEPQFTLTVRGFPKKGDMYIGTRKREVAPTVLEEFEITVPLTD